MAGVEKPYRVYRGGRVKGKVPLARPDRTPRRDGRGPVKPKIQRPRRRWSWKRRIAVAVLVVVLFMIVWSVAGFLVFRGGVAAANKRLPKDARAALSHQGGLILNNPTTILMLGTDHANTDQRVTDFHSDSIILMRTDPGKHRISYLSIPRDLRVTIPGHGEDRINTAMQIGGPALALRTVESFTGLPLNHVMIIDFHQFRQLIDNIGGIDIKVPEAILSNRFDCPFGTQQQCNRWKGWRFHKGWQHMSGDRAEIYSRIRENQLDPSYTDITRGQHQQQVLRAVESKLASFSTFLSLPFNGDSLVKPLTTDLSAWQFVQLGWVVKRASASRALHCRLGGSVASGSSEMIPSEENRAVIGEFTGQTAPQPPPPGSQFLPGCYIGNAGLK